MLPCSMLAFTEQIWMTKNFQSISHSLPSRLPSWRWTVIIKVYWLFLVTGPQISETGNFKISKSLVPLIHTSHCVTLFFPTSITFSRIQYSFAFISFLFIIQTHALHASVTILWIMKIYKSYSTFNAHYLTIYLSITTLICI